MFEILPRCDYQIGGVYVVALWKGGPYMGLSILNRYPKIKFFGMYVHTYGQTVLYRKHIYIYIYYRRKFRSQTSDNMDRWKAEQGKRKIRRKKSKRERVRRKKMQMREKVGKSRNTVFFQWFCGSGGSKSRLAKAAGAEPACQMSDEKLHTVVARSTFRSQNVQSTSASDHFWKLRCRKSARHCGAKHISKWKCTKTPGADHFGSWDVEKVHAVVARSTCPSENVQNTPWSDHFWQLRCRKKCTPLWREAHFEVKMYKTPHVCATFGGSDDVFSI